MTDLNRDTEGAITSENSPRSVKSELMEVRDGSSWKAQSDSTAGALLSVSFGTLTSCDAVGGLGNHD